MHYRDLQNYNIHIGFFEMPLKAFLEERNYSNIVIIVDENTRECCLPKLEGVLSDFSHFVIEIKSGEEHKTIETSTRIWTQMMDSNIDRSSLCINLGGGVIGDMGGFCASTFKRGIDFVQMPTTLLSQVDASIGGKLGIDFNEVKNSIGLFNNPEKVFIDVRFLETLPLREIRSGFAEIIKHSLIADTVLWQHLKKYEDIRVIDWENLMSNSLKIKQDIVNQDPFEKGIRKALNFGHTIGHAVESVALRSKESLLHGEAVAVGMIGEAYLSYAKGHLKKEALKEIEKYIVKIYNPIKLERENYPHYIELMQKDKKNVGAAINFTFLNAIGACIVNQAASAEEIIESLDYINEVL